MKYRLLGPHVTPGGERLEAGTEVGDDTGYPWKYPDGNDMDPSTQMEGLDEQSKEKVREVYQRLYGVGPAWEERNDEVRKAREQQAEEQKKLDEGSEPVSAQQRAERKWAKEDEEDTEAGLSGRESANARRDATVSRSMPGPAARQPSHTATASPTRPGVTTSAPGPATPQPPKADEIRPKKPNEEQYPKG